MRSFSQSIRTVIEMGTFIGYLLAISTGVIPPARAFAQASEQPVVRVEGAEDRRVDLFKVPELGGEAGNDLYPTREAAYKAAQDAGLTTFTVVTVSVRVQ